MREAGLMNGRLVPFCSRCTDSLVVGNGCISSFRSVSSGDRDIGKGTRTQSAASFLCLRDGGGSCN